MNKEKKISVFEQADRVSDLLVDEILALSDEEIMAEAQEEYENMEEEAKKIHGLIQKALFSYGKSRLKKAKLEFQEQKTKARGNLRINSLEKKIAIIKRLNSANDNISRKVTMAARKEEELSERDLDIYLQSAYELGLIDEEGNDL